MELNDSLERDAAFVAAVAAGKSVEAAAKLAGFSKPTGHRRMRDPEIRRQISELRAAMLDRVAGKLADRGVAAVDCLTALMDPATPEAQRLGAAWRIVALAFKAREYTELEERLTAIEQRIGEEKNR